MSTRTAELQALDHQYLMRTYDRYPIAIVRGEGVKVWDADGKEYLDFLGGIATIPLGHCHPAVVKAITEQAHTLMHASNLFYTEPALRLAELLVKQGGLDRVFFCNSGTEANEAAIKLARKYHWRKGETNRYQIISATQAFHGRTLGSLAATHKPELQQGFGPMPVGFQSVVWNDVAMLTAAIDDSTAAVLLEPVQGEGGINPATEAFLIAAREACNRKGALLIFDEIQCGLGRLGSFFAYQSYGIKPDMITLAKGIANGLPLGVLCATETVASGFQPGDHGTTFGGNPVATAAAYATLSTLLSSNYLARASQIGDYLQTQLQALAKRWPQAITAVRGKGLMVGIELSIDAKQVLRACHQHGLLANVTAGKVLRLLPPYIITEAEVDKAVAIIQTALEMVVEQLKA